MSIELAWYVSCDGDGSHIGRKFAEFPPSFETFTRVAQNAEKSGFTTLLVPTSQISGHYGREAPTWDSIINAAVVAPATKAIKLLLAVRPGMIHPSYCARMMASLDELSGGRIMYNIVTGGSDLSAYGDDLDHDTRYERTEEYIQVLEGLWTQDNFSFEGKYYRFRDASVYPRPVQKPRIPFFMAGASEIARKIAVRHGDYWVFWGETPDQVREQVEGMEKSLEGRDRPLKYVTRFQIMARDTEEEAFEAAEEVLSKIDPEVLAHRGKVLSKSDSKGTRNQQERTKEEMVGPNLWAGMGRIRSGSAVTIVGNYEQCARKIIEIEQAGVHLLILSGFPLHSECERIGEKVIPLVREMELDMGLINEEEDIFLKVAAAAAS